MAEFERVVEHVILLEEAAERLGVSEDVLTRLVQDGTIKAVQLLPGGEIAVNEDDVLTFVTREQFGDLQGQHITVTQASKKYKVSRNTILEWVGYGHIKVYKPGYKMEIDEADVAYYATVYHKKGGGRGKRILDQTGRPYQLKHPKLAEYRRQRKQSQIAMKRPVP